LAWQYTKSPLTPLRNLKVLQRNYSGTTGATGTKKRLRKNNINILFGLIDWFLGFSPSRGGINQKSLSIGSKANYIFFKFDIIQI